MAVRPYRVSVTLLGALAAAGLGAVFGAAPPKKPPSVETLVEMLGSDDYQTRENATLALMKRDDALTAVAGAARSPDAEVRRRASRVLPALRRRQLLARVAGGEADLSVEQMLARPELADGPVWAALEGLAEAVRSRANKEGKQKVPFPDVRGLRRVATPDAVGGLAEGRDLDGWRVLARGVSSLHGVVRCVVVSGKAVRCKAFISDSVVFANGGVSVCDEGGGGFIQRSVVVCDGPVEVDHVSHSVLIATGPVRVKAARDRNVVLIENAREPLGLLKFFTAGRLGVEVEGSGAGVAVKAVAGGKPFAKAGLRAGDVVTALGGEKVGSPEAFRLLLRKAAAEGGGVKLGVRRAGKALELAVPLGG